MVWIARDLFYSIDRTNGIDEGDGIDGKFPSSEALPIERSVTHQAKRPHLSYRASALPFILSKGRKGNKRAKGS